MLDSRLARLHRDSLQRQLDRADADHAYHTTQDATIARSARSGSSTRLHSARLTSARPGSGARPHSARPRSARPPSAAAQTGTASASTSVATAAVPAQAVFTDPALALSRGAARLAAERPRPLASPSFSVDAAVRAHARRQDAAEPGAALAAIARARAEAPRAPVVRRAPVLEPPAPPRSQQSQSSRHCETHSKSLL